MSSTRIGNLAVVVSAQTDPLRRGLQGAMTDVKRFGNRAAAANKVNPSRNVNFNRVNFDPITKGLRKVQKEAAKTHSSLGRLKDYAVAGVLTGGTAAAGMLGVDILGGMAGGVSGLLTDSVKLAAEYEKTSVAFEVMLGSAEKATNMLGELRTFAAESPFSMVGVTESAKQLKAYGLEANQIIPTLRMLGDAAVGDQTKLDRLAYAYGQVKSAGRLYGTELRQFTETGLPIIDEIAKTKGVQPGEVKNLVETGQVDYGDVVRSFKAMTSAGGQFYGMSEKFGQSFPGQMEQLASAVNIAKQEFGTILIDELGLSDATQDLKSFADWAKAGVAEFRPLVRFVGDAGKAAVQLGNEFFRVQRIIASVRGSQFLAAFPGLIPVVDKVQTLLKDAQNFKFDPVVITDMTLSFSEGMVDGVVMAWDALEALGKGLQTDLIDPFLDAVEDVGAMADRVLGVIDRAQRLVQAGKVAAAMAADPLGDRFAYMTQMARLMTTSGRPESQPHLEGVLERRDRATPDSWMDLYQQRLGGDAHRFRLGQFAAMGPMAQVVPADVRRIDDPNRPSQVRDFLGGIQDGVYSVRDPFMARAEDNKRQQERDAVARERNKAERFATKNYAAAAALIGTGFHAVDRAAALTAAALGNLAGDIENDRNRMAAVGGTMALGLVEATKANSSFKGQVSVGDGPGGMLTGLAGQYKQQFEDPLVKLKRAQIRIDDMLARGMIDERTAGLAFGAEVQSLGQLDREFKLPAAAELGSQQAASIIAAASAGKSDESLAGLLKRLLEETAQQSTIGRDQLAEQRKANERQPMVMRW